MASDLCADCGGFDIEWMRTCQKHNVRYCRGCECPYCAEETDEDELEYEHGKELDQDFGLDGW